MITEEITRTADEAVVGHEIKERGTERLEYYLYREEKNGRDSFSIQSIQYKNGEKICQATASDVSSRYIAAKKMFDSVSRGLVEPYILCDVIYDLLP